MGFWGYGGGNRLPWDRSFSSFLSSLFFLSLFPLSPFSAFLFLPSSASSTLSSFSLSLSFSSWPPYPRSFEPTPKFIPGGCYGDAPSSEWRQGIQRRRELWNEKYMVSKRTALGRSSKVEEKSGEGERRTRSSREKNRYRGEEVDARRCRERERERIRGEKDPTRARVSLPRIFERENRDSLNFRDRGRDWCRGIYTFLDVDGRWLDGIVDRQLDV